MDRMLAACAAASILSVYGGTASAQPMTPGEIIAVVDTPAFNAAMEACAEGRSVPRDIQLVITVGGDGSAALSSTVPPVLPDTQECFAGAVASLAFKPTAQAYTVKYDYTLAGPVEVAPVAPQPAPPEAREAPTVESPGADPAWKDVYRKGQSMFVGGIVLTALGGGLLIGTGLYALINVLYCVLTWGLGCNPPNTVAIIVIPLSGVALMAVGIPLLVTGIVRKRRAHHMKKGVQFSGLSLSPAPGFSGAVLSSGFRF
jgi:hypothetical protein